MKPAARIVLASASPRRRELLRSLQLDFEAAASDIPEDVDSQVSPEAAAARLALAKAGTVAKDFPSSLVIGADTIVVVGRQVLGKPADDNDARRMLALLRDAWHHVITGLALVQLRTGRTVVRTIQTRVRMKAYSEQRITEYLRSGEHLDKAGSYAIQGVGGSLVAEIEGCYTNVVGLPICEAARMLREAGLLLRAPSPVCADPDGVPCPREKVGFDKR